MAYTIDEQETHIWYDPKTKETIVETNYVHDINHYLRIIADGGMELLDHKIRTTQPTRSKIQRILV